MTTKATIIHNIDKWVEVKPDKTAYIFLDDGVDKEHKLSYQELSDKTSGLAAYLQQSFQKGDRILLFYPQGLDFIIAFFACLKAGLIAVPSFPPRMNRSLDRLKAIAENCNASAVLTLSTVKISARVSEELSLVNTSIIQTDRISEEYLFKPIVIDPEMIAFLQYTSGSTGIPKGVIVKHKNLAANLRLIAEAFHQTEETVLYGWLPFYHDMGLVGNVLNMAFSGGTGVFTSPVQFLMKPITWLQGISKYKVHTSGAPNFAYDLCAERIADADLEGIDLSAWQVAFNGAEQIRTSTLKAFSQKFNKVGFKQKSFYPCYGMAECTLFVSTAQLKEDISSSKISYGELAKSNSSNFDGYTPLTDTEIVSCGIPNKYEVAIYHDGQVASDGQIGEICLAGESVTSGYWDNHVANEEVFFPSPKTGNLLLRTGDLGVIRNKEIFVLGRSKDIVIVNGRNYYPHDIEYQVVLSDDHLINNSCAAVSIDDGNREKLVVICEIEQENNIDFQKVFEKITIGVYENFEINIDDIVLIRKASILKTTSGKVRRNDCKKAYLNDELYIIQRLNAEMPVSKEKVTGATRTGQRLLELIKNQLNIEIDNFRANLFSFGFDSIKVAQLSMIIVEEFDVQIDIDDVFADPTIAGLARQIDQSKTGTTSIEKAPVLKSYPLTAIQKGIWFDQVKRPSTNAYNVPLLFTFKDKYRADVLRKTLEEILRKYSVFRTTFKLEDNAPVQIITPSCEVDIPEVQFESLDYQTIEGYCQQESQYIFELSESPLFRVRVLRSEDAFKLFMVAHHILIDGIAVLHLIKEIKTTYKRILEKGSAESPPSVLQYSDYAYFENETLKPEENKSAESYWFNNLAGAEELNLRSDAALLKDRSITGASEKVVIDRKLLNKLHKVASKLDCSLYMLLLTSFKVLIYNMTKKSDIVIGAPVQTRNRKQLWDMQGIFLNTMMFRSFIQESSSFEEVLQQVKQTTLNNLKYRNYPFANIVDKLKIPYTKNKFPISSVFFNGHNFFDGKIELADLDCFLHNMGLDLNFDINCYTAETTEGLYVRFDYRKALFKETTVKQILRNFTALLKQVADNPKIYLSELKIAKLQSDLENESYYSQDGFQLKSSDATIIDQFEQIVKENSDRKAVVCGNEKYSYSELAAFAKRIASHLQPAGKQKCIGLLFGQEMNMIPSIMGTIYSDNIYVPLDIDYPTERILSILEDAEIEYVISSDTHRDLFRQLQEAHHSVLQLVNLDHLNPATGSIDLPRCSASDNAYILFTSGSTGKPKGVVQTHEYVVHLSKIFADSMKLSLEDHILLLASFNFSASVMDLFGSLLRGSCLHLFDVKTHGFPKLIEVIRESGITIYHSVPTLFRHFVRSINSAESFDKLRLIYLAGEPLLKKDIDLFQSQFNAGTILVNGLGCTEYNICRQFFVEKNTEVHSTTIPIGYKTPGIDVILVDEHRNEIFDNREGEIAIVGDTLAVGYWKQDELTKAKFQKLPSGKRIYYTGDVGQYGIDGCLHHMGRKDFQIKIDGKRVETAEIETAILEEVTGVEHAVVKSFKEDEKHLLCAFLIGKKEMKKDEITATLEKRLPGFMIPSHFEYVHSFPTTNTGKVDRNKLLKPKLEIEQHSEIGDLNLLERNMVAMISDILNLKESHISISANFFDIGLSSVHLLQLHNQLTQQYEVTFPISSLFQYSSIAKLSGYISNECGVISDAEVPEVSYQEEKDTLLDTIDLLGQFNN